jgi:hypothetical protein
MILNNADQTRMEYCLFKIPSGLKFLVYIDIQIGTFKHSMNLIKLQLAETQDISAVRKQMIKLEQFF